MNPIDLIIYIIVFIGALGLILLFFDNILGRTTGRSLPGFNGGKRKK